MLTNWYSSYSFIFPMQIWEWWHSSYLTLEKQTHFPKGWSLPLIELLGTYYWFPHTYVDSPNDKNLCVHGLLTVLYSVHHSGNWSVSHVGQQSSWDYNMPWALFSLKNPQQELFLDSTGPPLKDGIDRVCEIEQTQERRLDSVPDSQSPVTVSTDNLLFRRRCVYQGLQLMC